MFENIHLRKDVPIFHENVNKNVKCTMWKIEQVKTQIVQ